jgi:hypothetical protein
VEEGNANSPAREGSVLPRLGLSRGRAGCGCSSAFFWGPKTYGKMMFQKKRWLVSLAVLGTMGLTLFCVFAVSRPTTAHASLRNSLVSPFLCCMRLVATSLDTAAGDPFPPQAVATHTSRSLSLSLSHVFTPPQIGEPLVTMAAVALQSGCLFWYTISYIPFMRTCVKTAAGRCFGALLEDEF